MVKPLRNSGGRACTSAVCCCRWSVDQNDTQGQPDDDDDDDDAGADAAAAAAGGVAWRGGALSLQHILVLPVTAVTGPAEQRSRHRSSLMDGWMDGWMLTTYDDVSY